jgi:very-short-patch-repair endonuclease
MTEIDYRIAPDCFESIGDVAFRITETILAAWRISPLCESPIEIDLGAQILRLLPDGYELIAQYRFDRFRYDFAITHEGRLCAFVECDGRAFHSTPEQIENDRKKDAVAAAASIKMFRYTGSEIVRDARHCAQKIMDALAE